MKQPADSISRPERRAFCEFLRKGRESSALSLDEIARITRIPQRSLERLERGEFEKLPADVFVRGFLRSYADCVGLDPDDAVRRYAECGLAPSPVAQHGGGSVARGTPPPELARGSRRKEPAVLRPVEPEPEPATPVQPATGAESAPEPAIESAPEPAIESAPEPAAAARSESGSRKKRRRRPRKKGRKRRTQKTEMVAANADVVDAKVDAVATAKVEQVDDAPAPVAVDAPDPDDTALSSAQAEPAGAESAVVIEPVIEAPPAQAPIVDEVKVLARPVLRIDDDDPTGAELIQDQRAEREGAEREASKRAFLPAALLEEKDGSRRGALTLAVIILVIVATLTMSYLLRHPSSSGSGVTDLGQSELRQA